MEDFLADAFGPNARKIIDSTPARERERLQQMMAAQRERLTDWVVHASAEDMAAYDRTQQEMADALADWTAEDWAELASAVEETERQILRERGVDPE